MTMVTKLRSQITAEQFLLHQQRLIHVRSGVPCALLPMKFVIKVTVVVAGLLELSMP